MLGRTIHNRLLVLLPLAGILALSSCNMPGFNRDQAATATGNANATAAAQTVAAELTAAAGQPSDTPLAATNTPTPSETPDASATPTESGCTDRATFVTDVTIPDDTNVAAGDSFTKTWRLRNTGTCTWTSAYDLVFSSGNAMSGPASEPLVGSVPPNGTVDLSVELKAPNNNGTYRGDWMLRNADNLTFGIGAQANGTFWVQIVVGPTPTPQPSVYNTGKVNVASSFYVDLDEAKNPADTNADRDMWYHGVSPVERYLEPINGAEAFVFGDNAPAYHECDDASLSSDPIDFDDFGVGDWICFETGEGRIGRFEVEALVGNPPVITMDIRTWDN